ncbi:MAG: restriction endonuclease subunit S, partial [Bacteroidia bacterium]
MKSNYKRLGDYIQLVEKRNKELKDLPLVGLSISKQFIPSIANTIGTDMTTYKIINRNQLAYSPVTSRNGDKITIALFQDFDKALISQAYTPFEVKDTNELLPEYLMMWFRRPEFDRYARFMSHGSAREIFSWEDFCEMQLPIPSISKQKEIVAEYKVIQNRIALNQQLIQKLEETAQAIYKQWFVDFEFPDEDGKPYKSSGGEMVESELGEIPKGWRAGKLEDVSTQIMGFAFKGEEYVNDKGISVLRGENVSEKFLRWDNHKKWDNEIVYRMEKCYLQENDIVIGMDGSKVGKNWAMISRYDLPLLLAQRVSCLRAKNKEYQNFIFYSMCVLCFENHVSQVQTGTSIPHISGQQIFDFLIVIPERKQVEKFDYFISKMVVHKQNISTENQQLLDLQNLLLSKLA